MRRKCVLIGLGFYMVLFWSETVLALPIINGTITPSISLVTGNCKSVLLAQSGAVAGGLVCNPATTEGGPLIAFVETQADLSIKNLIGGPLDLFRSFSDFSFINPFTTGLTLQALELQFSLGDLVTLKETVIFAPNIVQFFSATNTVRAFGFLSPGVLFRRSVSTFQISLIGATLGVDLLLDDLRETQTDSVKLVNGLRVQASTKTLAGATVSTKLRFGLKPGIECFSLCVGPFQLVEDVVVGGEVQTGSFGFEDWSLNVSGISIAGFDLNISTLVKFPHGFSNAFVGVGYTLKLPQFDVVTSSSWTLLSNLKLFFGGVTAIITSPIGEGTGTLTLSFSPDLLTPPAGLFDFVAANPSGSQFSTNLTPGRQLDLKLVLTRTNYSLTFATQFAAQPSPPPQFKFRTVGITLEFAGDPITFRTFYGFSTVARSGALRFEAQVKF